VILDLGFWARGEWSALRRLAAAAGASCQVVYLRVDLATQWARITHRQVHAPHETFAISQAEPDSWRPQFEAPDTARAGRNAPSGPPGVAGLARLGRRPLAITGRGLSTRPGPSPAPQTGPLSHAANMRPSGTPTRPSGRLPGM
jgi:hypothetical protein